MQCQSYFPVYPSNYDLNFDVNGSARPINKITNPFPNGYSGKYISPSTVSQEPLELLRQTILMHEATFKDQVQELHRLYERQREIMGELRSKEVYMNHIQLSGQSSNSFSKCSSTRVQNILDNYPLVNLHCKPTIGAYNIQMPFDSIKELKTHSPRIVSPDDIHLNNLHVSESKARKIGKRFLDLELPAEVYIDSEDREAIDDAKLVEAPMPFGPYSDEPSDVLGTCISSGCLQAGFRSPRSFSQSSTFLANLNEPEMASYFKKKDEIFGKGYEVGHTNPDLFSGSCWRKTSLSPENNSCVVQALPCFDNQISSGAKLISRTKGHNIDHKHDVSSKCTFLKSGCSESILKDSLASLSSITSDYLMNVNCLIDLNSDIDENMEFTPSDGDGKEKNATSSRSCLSEVSFSCEDDTRAREHSITSTVNSLGSETTRKGKKCKLIDINLPYDHGTEEEPVDDDHVGGDYKNSTKMDFSHGAVLEINLEEPPSPEVEERPPPRGDSEENQPESRQFSTAEDADNHFLELANLAAEAIVSISSSFKSETNHGSRDFQTREVSDSDTLEWFAGLINSIRHDRESDLGTLSSIHDPHEIDEFEALTLELTEMKDEEYWCKNSSQIENFNCAMPLVDVQTRKERTRRSKRKDFQREVLPSLASLSRYEVTEDIQMIEGLMEAAGTPWRLTRGRRACRKPRAVKQLSKSPSDVPDLKGGALMSWMKPNRRLRRPRNPASASMVLTRWLEFSA